MSWYRALPKCVRCGGKLTELLCSKMWNIDMGNIDDSVTQDTHNFICALNRTADLL